MTNYTIGTRDEWLAARRELLDAEKEHMRQSDELARRRRNLPWVPVENEYVFDTDDGAKTLVALFDGRSQLLVYHFMFGYGDDVDERSPGCTGCSFVADHFDGAVPHLNGHDVTLVAESIAPLEELRRYKQRMRWRFPWVSSLGSDFKYDFGAAFTHDQQRAGAEYNYRHIDDPGQQAPGMSAFALADGVVYHTYSTYARGVEQLMGTYRYLDLAPLGRNEETAVGWWRRHDEYDPPARYNARIIDEFRANQGHVGGIWAETPLLLLHHTGARSGLSRVNPVAYLPDDRGYLIWAGNGGAPNNPDWYHNLKAHPNTRIEVGSGTVDVRAEEATGAERERLWARATERYPQLIEAAQKTSRVIPMVVLTPRGKT
jgi:deazaflavin-dependent oxidoreductase (nitroreductase family)